MAKEKVILAYSGGLDTSVIMTWLKENYDYDVIAVCCNAGQKEDFDAIEKKAIATGASKAITIDLREEFITDFSSACIFVSSLFFDMNDMRLYNSTTSSGFPFSSATIVSLPYSFLVQYPAGGMGIFASLICSHKSEYEMSYFLTIPEIEIAHTSSYICLLVNFVTVYDSTISSSFLTVSIILLDCESFALVNVSK